MIKKNRDNQQFQKILTKFQESVDWLLSLVTDPTGERYFTHRSQNQRQKQFEQQLGRTAAFLDFIGNPQRCFNSVHVAGTSGKGSVVVMLASMLKTCDLRTGYHTSPYLQIPNEKLVIDDCMISPSQFCGLINELQKEIIEWQQTKKSTDTLKYIEAWAVLTYKWMAQQQVDWAVVETGVGGRFDPTNVLPSQLAVLTDIDLDHVEVLGRSMTDIAWHKAGIIKADAIAITSDLDRQVIAVFQREADNKRVRLYKPDQDFSYDVHRIHDCGSVISVRGPYNNYPDLDIKLPGDFQTANAALAVAAMDLLREHYQLPVNLEAVQTGLASAFIPGRMEVVQHQPLVILDGAHNSKKMRALVDSLRRQYPDERFTIVIGMLANKDAQSMIGVLSPISKRFIATQPCVYGKPAFPAKDLARIINEKVPGQMVEVSEEVIEAMETAFEQASERDEKVLVTGSLYVVGQARERWYPSLDILYKLEKRIPHSY